MDKNNSKFWNNDYELLQIVVFKQLLFRCLKSEAFID